MDTSSLLDELRADRPLISPSLLACDFGHLAREVAAVEAAGAHLVHLDVMDGHFVPNLSFGLPIVEAVRRVTDLPLDVHLMITEPARYVEQFRQAGADLITIHAEAVDDPVPLLRRIRDLGALAGISINPPTPVTVLERCAGECDLVLIMSVMPGFGGQSFQAEVLDKFRWLRSRFGWWIERGNDRPLCRGRGRSVRHRHGPVSLSGLRRAAGRVAGIRHVGER